MYIYMYIINQGYHHFGIYMMYDCLDTYIKV